MQLMSFKSQLQAIEANPSYLIYYSHSLLSQKREVKDKL